MVSIRIVSIANFLRVANTVFGPSVVDSVIAFDVMGAVQGAFDALKNLGTDEARFRSVLSALFQAGAIEYAITKIPFKKSVTMFGITLGL